MPHIDEDAQAAIAALGGLDAVRWIDAKVSMPPLEYSSKMRYWYSKAVLTKNAHAIEVQVAMSHDGKDGGFLRPVGGKPTHWAHLHEKNA